MSAVKASSSSHGSPHGPGERMREYFGSLKYEWQKISWPEKKQWMQSTTVVFIFVLVLIGVLMAFDWLASMVLDNMLGLR